MVGRPLRVAVRRLRPGPGPANRGVQDQKERHVPVERCPLVRLAHVHQDFAVHHEGEVLLRVFHRKLVEGRAPVSGQGSALVDALVADRVRAVFRWPRRLPVVRATPASQAPPTPL